MTFTEEQRSKSFSHSCSEPRLDAKTAWRRKTATLPVDADGNLTQDGRWDYVYDAENHLTSMTAISSAPAAAKKKLEFVFGSGTVLRSYAWGLDLSGSMQGASGVGGLLAMNNTSDSSSHFYAYDGNGNVVALVNAATGVVSAEYEYGPFGETIRQTGTMASVNTHRFSTKTQDSESGFYCYDIGRYMDPSKGRWLTREPLNDEAFYLQYTAGMPQAKKKYYSSVRNQPEYLFVLNNPIRYYDPNGLNPMDTDADNALDHALNDQAGLSSRAHDVANDVSDLGKTVATEAILATVSESKVAKGLAEKIAEKISGIAKKLFGKKPCPPKMGAHKSPEKWKAQKEKRGWTDDQISEAIESGEKFPADNKVNPGNSASRYVNPESGKSVVVDDVTGEVLHVGGEGFQY